MESSDFMWLAGDTDINNKELFNFQFSHIFYRDNYINSNYFKNLNDLITKIKPLSLIRIKANLMITMVIRLLMVKKQTVNKIGQFFSILKKNIMGQVLQTVIIE